MNRLARFFLIAAVTLCFSFPAFAQGRAEVSAYLASQGEAALAANDLTGALGYFERAMVADPDNIAAYIGLGRTFESAGARTESMKYYRLALAIEPTNLKALELQGLGYLAQESPGEAKANLEKMKVVCQAPVCAEVARLEAAIGAADENQ